MDRKLNLTQSALFFLLVVLLCYAAIRSVDIGSSFILPYLQD